MSGVTARRVDHLVHAVPDLDHAASQYEEAGFRVTPRADHPFGTSNRLVVLASSYVELVTVTRAELVAGGFADRIRRQLEEGPGLAFLAFASEYAAADHAALQRTGLAVGDVMRFSRPATLSDGSETQASFSVVFTPGLSGFGMFLCQHHSPGVVWDPEYQNHPNEARRLTEVHGSGQLDRQSIQLIRAITGATSSEDSEGVRFALHSSELVFGPGSAVPRLVGFSVSASHTADIHIEGAEIHLVGS